MQVYHVHQANSWWPCRPISLGACEELRGGGTAGADLGTRVENGRAACSRAEGKLAVTALGGSLRMSAQRSIYQLQNQCVHSAPFCLQLSPLGLP